MHQRGPVPVDARTIPPCALRHGGVSVVLAEMLGSCGAAYQSASGSRLLASASAAWVAVSSRSRRMRSPIS